MTTDNNINQNQINKNNIEMNYQTDKNINNNRFNYSNKHKNNKKNNPIISYGIINIYVDSKCKYYDDLCNIMKDNIQINSKKININDYNNYFMKIDKKLIDNIRENLNEHVNFLLINRKYSVEYIEFIQGKYIINDKKTYIKLIELMTKNEISALKNNDFKKIWYDLWNRDPENKYSKDYEISKKKFEQVDKNIFNENLSKYDNLEWGFPKGRKNKSEPDMKCAIREFEEESGLNINNYNIFNNISPLSETFNGTNNLMYKHIYYLSYSDKKIDFDKKFIDVSYEVSDIGWFNYYESIKNIRSYHVTKKLLIESILNFLVLYIININKNNNI